jgi:exopolysaccharide biosynthesis polyprenyl glycosylphosphotransferase
MGEMRSQTNLILKLLPAADAVLLAFILSAVWAPARQNALSLVPVLLVVPFWVFLLGFFAVYSSNRLEGTAGLTRKLLSVQITGSVTMTALLLAVGQGRQIPKFALFVAIGTLVLALERAFLYLLLHILRSRGFDSRNVCVIGSWESAADADQRFSRHREWGLRVSCVGIGTVHERKYLRYPGGEPISTSLEDLVRTQVVDEILIALAAEDLAQEKATISLCQEYGVVGRVLLHPSSSELAQPHLEVFTGETTITVGKVPSDSPAAIWKRVIDIVLGSLLLTLLSPLMLISAVLVKLSLAGPIIFKQRRAGIHGRPFVIYKFRTMVGGAEGMVHALAGRSVTGGPTFKDRSDVRVTPIGRILRRFSIDELPQLFNVIAGTMSLVGPRPLPLHEAAEIFGVHRRRFSMRPGITCFWQVNGRSNVEFSKWMSYDLQYVDHWSLWLDTKLLVQTIPAVLSGRGAY